MDDFIQFRHYRREAIKYWERRRIIWNLLLVPPALFSYWFALQFPDPEQVSPVFGFDQVAMLFFAAAVGANICYCAAYIAEFLMADSNLEGGWQNGGRTAVFVAGCVIGVGLALAGGQQIAMMQLDTGFPVGL